MSEPISRRHFAGLGTGLVLGAASTIHPASASADDKPVAPTVPQPIEAAFEPRLPHSAGFKPSWKKPLQVEVA